MDEGGVQARGGGESQDRSAERPTSLTMTMVPTTQTQDSLRMAGGGGKDIVAADQPVAMPPQASMARRTR